MKINTTVSGLNPRGDSYGGLYSSQSQKSLSNTQREIILDDASPEWDNSSLLCFAFCQHVSSSKLTWINTGITLSFAVPTTSTCVP